MKRAVEAGEYKVDVAGVARVVDEQEPPFWADRKSDHFDPIEAQTWQELFTDKALSALR